MAPDFPDQPQPFGDLVKRIVAKSRPSRKALKGRRLAQKVFTETYGERAARATVAAVKAGIVTLETDSTVLFQELEGFEKRKLIELFRNSGLNVRDVRVKLIPASH